MIVPCVFLSFVVFTIFREVNANSIELSGFATGLQGLRVVGMPSSETGHSVANAGDFNNDGVSDFIFGSPGIPTGSGVAFIIMGSITLGAEEIDISTFTSGSTGIKLIGKTYGE